MFFIFDFFVQAVEDLRRKCEQVHAHLLETELTYAHRPQIRGLNIEQVPIEIEQAKVVEGHRSCDLV